jgi:hypothetical protein
MMRISAAALLVLVGMIAGYALRGAPVSAQSMLGSWLPLIDFPEGSTTCKVTQVINGFVGCAGEDTQRRSDRWINLRFVKDVTRRNP